MRGPGFLRRRNNHEAATLVSADAAAGNTAARCWALLLARSPPQLAFGFDQTPTSTDWPEMDQAAAA
jgi:hypothetical protein